MRPILLYYAIEIDTSFFLSGSLRVVPWDFHDVLDVDLSSLFIVGNRLIEFSWIPTLTLKDRNS
jgi:hypothetical protein